MTENEPIQLVPPDPGWPAQFELERAALEEAIGGWACGGIHHVGSQGYAAHDNRFAAGPYGFEVNVRDNGADYSAISAWASAAPMQRRMPPPKGSKEYGVASSSMKRSPELVRAWVEILAEPDDHDRRIDPSTHVRALVGVRAAPPRAFRGRNRRHCPP